MGPLAGSQVRELVQSGELTASDSIRNVNSQNWVRIDSVPQLASELSKPKSSPKNKDVDLEHPQQVQLKPDQAKGTKSGLLQEGSSPILTHAETLKTSVAEDGVSPPSIGFFTHSKKTRLGVVVALVFCSAWWSVAGEAWQARWQAKQEFEQFKYEYEQAKPEGPARQQAAQQAQIAAQQAENRIREVANQDYQRGWENQQRERELAINDLPKTNGSGGAIRKKQNYDSSEYQQAEQAAKQAQEAKEIASEEWAIVKNGPENLKRFEAILTEANSKFLQQASWGIGAGVLADLLVLALALAGIQMWSKLTAKP